jgi:hypothetical protein
MAIELMKYLNERFPALTLDAGLFYRWPVGIRFDLGGRPDPSSQVMSGVLDRATVLYEALFEADDKCVVIAQDWPRGDIPPPRYTNLFDTPGTGLAEPQGTLEVSAREESGDDHSYTLRWSEESARGFQYRTILLGLANADHGQIPGVAIEDDCGSEYRFAGRPIPALMSLDRCSIVIMVGRRTDTQPASPA